MSFIFCSIAYSQDVLSVDEMNSIYRKDHHVNKKVNKYSPLRQAGCYVVKKNLERNRYERKN